MPDQHALLSASGAHRWLACPPSATLEAGLPESSSQAAEQGTAAHALAEWKLRRRLHGATSARPVSSWHDAEMDTLTDDYAAFVQERLRDVQHDCTDLQVLIEQRLDFSHIVPGGFGTGDCVIIAEPTLQIIDLKYGQGVMVEAEHNPQLMLYALGALNAFGSLYDITEVAVTIFQPRRSNISTWTISVAELLAWAEQVVKPRAALAARGDGEFAAGSWCQFCKLAPTCRTRAEANLTLAQHEFAPPAELTDAEIAQVLAQLPDLKSWAADVEAHALSLSVNQGKTWPGFKLVEGRSVRKYSDESAVAQAAKAAGVDVWDRKLKTITALEKQLGKKRFTELLGDLVVKPAGKPTLAPNSDKRPALELQSAANDFTAMK
ncbi:PD-(D/E)XK nuclease superfamily protein [Corynebacterium diphtheriae subsp. lausannense]|nr:PD-(D/E)XK nuclease superfamily protein [Corynebacterium diphtheriae subsp. lausannense]